MDIWVLDKNLNKIGLISSFISLTYNGAFNSEGSFELRINANKKEASYIAEDRIIYLDRKRAGIIKFVETTKNNNKSGETVIAKGYELKDMISHRVTEPPSASTSGYDEYTSQTTEYVVRQLLIKQIINPEDTKRKIAIFALAPYQGYGSTISFSTRYKSLPDEIYALLAADKLGIECDVDIELKIATLRIVAPTDRSFNQEVNKRAIFAINLGTLINADKLIDSRAYKNYGYVAGQGEGAERTVIKVYSTEAEPEGFDRREVFIDARDIQDAAELPQRGMNKLSELDKIISFDGTIKDLSTMTYDNGDLVTIMDSNITGITKQIVGIGYDYYNGSIVNKRVTFGNNTLSISQAISKRLKDINNELTR